VEDEIAARRRPLDSDARLKVALDKRLSGERLGVRRANEVVEDQFVTRRFQTGDQSLPQIARRSGDENPQVAFSFPKK
jgi:hypothetical protein